MTGLAAMVRASPRRWARQFQYAPVLALAMGTMMVRLLVLAKLLPVQEFSGLGVGLLVSSTFCMLGCLGLYQLLQRDWPLGMVRGRERRGVVLAAQCMLVALGSAALWLVPAISVPLGGASSTVLVLGVLHGFCQQAFLTLSVESRSRGDAMRFARQNLWRSLLTVAAGVAAALYMHSAALVLVVECLVAALLSVFMFRKAASLAALGLRAALVLAVRRIHYINWKAAFTMMAVAVLAFITLNADRWLAAARLDVADFAVYSFAWIVLLTAQSLQALLNASLYPRLARTFGTEGRRAAFGMCLRYSTAMLVAGIAAAVPAWWLLEWAVGRWFMPYQAAAGLLPLFLSVAVLRVADFWSSYLLVVGREKSLLVSNAVAGIAGIMWWVLCLRSSAAGGVQDIALLAVALAVLAYGATVGMAWRHRA
jgi:O-antigen/teichoic acid export membrane protein